MDSLPPQLRPVLGLHHAGVSVADLERSIAFYREVFGLEVGERLLLGSEKIAFLTVGSSRLELIEGERGVRQAATGVIDHVAFEVADLDGLVVRLRELGVTLLDEAPLAVAQLHARIFFCLGPDGERIELFEYGDADVR